MENIISRVFSQAIYPFLTFLFALATVIFIWGVVEFIINSESEDKRTTGKKHIIWGIVGLFIMFSVWGIITMIRTFVRSF